MKKMKRICLLAALLTFIVQGHVRAQQKKYNVLFIAVDDLNTDLETYGHPIVKSPSFSRLAKVGVKFDNAYCQFTWCCPSRTSLLTGLRPDHTGVYDLKTYFRTKIPGVITLPQMFKQQGYYSARVGKIFHYGVPDDIGTNGLDDSVSWDKRVNPKGIDRIQENNITNLQPGHVLGNALSYWAAPGSDDDQTDGKVALEAIKLLQENKDRPFFIAVGFYRPHTPYVAPKKYFDMYPLDQIKLPAFDPKELETIPKAALIDKVPNFGLSDTKLKEAIRGYYAVETFMDVQVGRVMDELERLKLTDHTIVVLWSDHGYLLGEHGQWMKQTLFEKTSRVPLIIAGPEIARNKVSQRPVELVDLYPTLAELCHLEVKQQLDGISIASLLKKPDAKWNKPAFTQVTRGKIMGRSIRTERWRYTEWDEGNAGVELYDERKYREDRANLAKDPAYTETIKGLSTLLHKSYRVSETN